MSVGTFASAITCVDPFNVRGPPGIVGGVYDIAIGAVAVATFSRSHDSRRGCMITTGLPPRATSTLRASVSGRRHLTSVSENTLVRESRGPAADLHAKYFRCLR
jgi:hypothetical protein